MSHPSAFSTDTHRGPADTCPACTAPVETDDDHATPQDTLDVLTDVTHTLWALVDDVTPLVHAENDAARRVELRAVQEHVTQAWAQAQHAATALQTLVALAVPEHEQPGFRL